MTSQTAELKSLLCLNKGFTSTTTRTTCHKPRGAGVEPLLQRGSLCKFSKNNKLSYLVHGSDYISNLSNYPLGKLFFLSSFKMTLENLQIHNRKVLMSV